MLLKLDGYRAIAIKANGRVQLRQELKRSPRSWTKGLAMVRSVALDSFVTSENILSKVARLIRVGPCLVSSGPSLAANDRRKSQIPASASELDTWRLPGLWDH